MQIKHPKYTLFGVNKDLKVNKIRTHFLVIVAKFERKRSSFVLFLELKLYIQKHKILSKIFRFKVF